MKRMLVDKSGRSYPLGFCAACGVPLERPGTFCHKDCQRAYARGKRPIPLLGRRPRPSEAPGDTPQA